MNICVFDTETTDIKKPFCYNIGYVIVSTETKQVLVSKDFVVEQVWHNPMLFTTAYYADKRPLYIDAMRAHRTIMDKFGYICREMARDFVAFNVTDAYAYNSDFDERVFQYNCDWFKCINPFDNITIHDIRGFAHKFLVNDDYLAFCEQNEYFTESGNYSTTAETMFRYVSHNNDFIEEHTALADAVIEKDILFACANDDAVLSSSPKARVSIERKQERELHIRTAEQTDYYFKYNSIRISKDRTDIKLK